MLGGGWDRTTMGRGSSQEESPGRSSAPPASLGRPVVEEGVCARRGEEGFQGVGGTPSWGSSAGAAGSSPCQGKPADGGVFILILQDSFNSYIPGS